jgi:hypothetical protein
MTAAASLMHIDRLELVLRPKPWAFADEHRAEIDAHFASLQRAKPAVWNGRVLVMHEHMVADGVLHGAYLETDYASFAAGAPGDGRRAACAIVSAPPRS